MVLRIKNICILLSKGCRVLYRLFGLKYIFESILVFQTCIFIYYTLTEISDSKSMAFKESFYVTYLF